MKERNQLLKNKLDGISVEKERIENNKTNLEKLDIILEKNKNQNYEQREIYEEEQNAINDWEDKKREQDNQLEDIKIGIIEMKNEARKVGENIKKVGDKLDPLKNQMHKTDNHIKTQNVRLKELLNKFRKSDKICCDLILVLILIGLIMVLYRIIKKK